MKIWSIAGMLALVVMAGTAFAQENEAAADAPEANADEVVTFTASPSETAETLLMEAELWIDAPVEHVWNCAVNDIDGWWPHFYKEGSSVHIEPWAGGRVYEKFAGSAGEALYGHVLYVDPLAAIKIDGQWGMGGAAVSGGVWYFEEQDGGTRFRMRGQIMGTFDEEMEQGRIEGTKGVLMQLKEFCETGVRIERKYKAATE